MILFVYGPDSYRVREKSRELIDQFRQKRDSVGINVVKFSGENLDFDRLRQETMTQGFLSEKKMIVVDRLLSLGNTETQEKVLEFINEFAKKKSETNILLFVEEKVGGKIKNITKKLFTALKNQQYAFEFPELVDRKLEHWINDYVARLGGNIDAKASGELAVRVGSNLWRMSNELQKLVNLKQKQTITQDDIDEHINATFEENIFTLTESIVQKDKNKALRLLSDTIDGGANEIYLLTMIVRQFRILLQVKSLVDSGNSSAKSIANNLGLHPYVTQKSLPLAKHYTLDQLKKIYSRLSSIDASLKTSHPNPQLLLNLLIIDREPNI